MRNRFDRQLVKLNESLIQMGMLVEEAIAGAVGLVVEGNMENAEKVIADNEEIKDKEREIERLCMKMLLQQQPVASDLRKISSALKMITDLERMGNQAADICEISVKMYVTKNYIPPQIKEMASEVIYMVNSAVEAYVKNDCDLAVEVIEYDNKVDALFNSTKAELVQRISDNAEGSDESIDILMIAKYLEKIGDHAVNTADWVVFSIKGIHVD
ncbi:MAG: phosphate signaling complex protein PhoU [Firmicutes bacterium]|nr:phosphate signaling complex protein PhoU [Bacillota bacterium]